MDTHVDEQEGVAQCLVLEHRDVLLHLAVLAAHLGQPLTYNVYFDNKLIAEKGRIVSERMVARLRLLDPQHLFFKASYHAPVNRVT